MIKIDFLVPGFSKCGTTTLCALLAQHPDLYIPELKEPWYFSARDFPRQQAEYIQHFSPALPGQLLGEGSVSYSGSAMGDVSAVRIKENNPDCRFIFIARNPLHRIESSYREMHHSGVKFGLNAPYDLAECLSVFPQMIEDSLYFARISNYVDTFGSDSILVLFLEDLTRHSQLEMEKCFRHLGVDSTFGIVEELRLNEGASKFYDSRILRYLRTAMVGFQVGEAGSGGPGQIAQATGFASPLQETCYMGRSVAGYRSGPGVARCAGVS